MESIKIFENKELKELKKVSRKTVYGGFLYVVEFGNYVKVGYSSHPYSRLMNIQSMSRNYYNVSLGRFWLSPEHTNYQENEHKAHSLLKDYRKKDSELFSIGIKDAITRILASDIEFKDESSSLERESNSFFYNIVNLFPVSDRDIEHLLESWYDFNKVIVQSESLFTRILDGISCDHIVNDKASVDSLRLKLSSMSDDGEMKVSNMSNLMSDLFELKISYVKGGKEIDSLFDYLTWKEDKIRLWLEDDTLAMSPALLNHVKKETESHVLEHEGKAILSTYYICEALMSYTY